MKPWAFGHWGVEFDDKNHPGYYTMMSYHGECDADPLTDSPCTRILYFSNPGITYDGWFVTGIAGARDNASVIAEFAPTCAQYRASLGRIFANGFE